MNGRERQAAYQRRRRSYLNDEEQQRERERLRGRMQRRRAQINAAEEQRIRESDAEAHRNFRQRRTTRQAAAENQLNAASHHQSRQLESPTSHRQRINVVIESNARRNQIRIEAARNEAINFSVVNVAQHSCGEFNCMCQFCGSFNFKGERPRDGKFNSSCRKGKFKLPTLTDNDGIELKYPNELQQLIVTNHTFRDNIRSYNNAMSFASMGAKMVDIPGRGPYVFKIQGHAYHVTSHIQPVANEQPQYGQLYFIDTTQSTESRLQHPANRILNPAILRQLDQLIRRINVLAQKYKLMREVVEQYPPN